MWTHTHTHASLVHTLTHFLIHALTQPLSYNNSPRMTGTVGDRVGAHMQSPLLSLFGKGPVRAPGRLPDDAPSIYTRKETSPDYNAYNHVRAA